MIQLTGDQRHNVSAFLKAIELAKAEQLNIHGFKDAFKTSWTECCVYIDLDLLVI